METINEFIPFAKEMLSQRPNRRMVKMYVLGSTMAMLGVVGGLVETVLLPFVDREPVEDQVLDLYIERSVEKKEVKRKRSVAFRPEVTDVEETEKEMEMESIEEAKAKHLVKAGRRMSSNRLHAS